MILFVYAFLRLFNLKFNKDSFYLLIKDFFTITPLLLLTLYIVGYFEIRIVDTLALGLGSTVWTTPGITINSSQVATFAQNPVFPDGGSGASFWRPQGDKESRNQGTKGLAGCA